MTTLDSSSSSITRINVWSTPRTLSTALLYSFAQRADTHAVDEPLYAHDMHQRPHLQHKRPYLKELFATQSQNGAEVVEKVMLGDPDSGSSSSNSGKKVLYMKHMAKHIIGLDLALFIPHTHNILLIRDPVQVLASFEQKLGTDATAGATLEETGYPELIRLYSEVERLTGKPPLVVNPDDLKKDPEGILRAVCASVGIEFDPQMLEWEEGPKEVDGCWAKFWYADGVWKSRGFSSRGGGEGGGEGGEETHTHTQRQRAFPQHLFPLLRLCLPFYEALVGQAVKTHTHTHTHTHTNGGGAKGEVAPAGAATTSSKINDEPPTTSSTTSITDTHRDRRPTITDHGLSLPSGPLRPDPANLNLLIWVNGRLLPRDLAQVSVFDSIVQGGDGVWEGLRVYDGRVMKLEAHLDRLQDSAKALDFKIVPSREEVKEALFTTLAANGMRDGVHVRLTLTRGEKTTSSMNPLFNIYGCTLIIVPEWKPVGGLATYDNAKGIELVTAATRRNPPSCLDSKIHHNNLLNNILAKCQANHAHAQDAIMLDIDGYVSETNATNIFMVKKGCVLTPHADHCLPGITRQTVIDIVLNVLKMECVERRVSLSEFHAADEVFTTGTMGELTPVSVIDGRWIGKGEGEERWPITRRIQEAYRELTEKEGTVLP